MANLVGILVVLLALVGLGVRREQLRLQSPERLQQRIVELQQRLQAATAAREAAAERIERIETAVRDRAKLAEQLEADRIRQLRLLAALEARADQLRRQLEQLADRHDALEALLQQRERQRHGPAPAPANETRGPVEPVVVELKVPISRPVPQDAEEIHFELRGGRVTYIPLERLLAQARQRVREAEAHGRPQELSGVVGPVGAFSLRFRAVRPGGGLQERVLTGSFRPRLRLVAWHLIPAQRDRGEVIERAMADGSRFWAALAGRTAERTYVTFWVYEDSFRAFRTLRAALYERGYFVAARPLFLDDPIAGAAHGTPSYAQ